MDCFGFLKLVSGRAEIKRRPDKQVPRSFPEIAQKLLGEGVGGIGGISLYIRLFVILSAAKESLISLGNERFFTPLPSVQNDKT
jgi:hypothetical protein